jgi:hypothetical protein
MNFDIFFIMNNFHFDLIEAAINSLETQNLELYFLKGFN